MPSLILADLVKLSALAQPRKGHQVPIELSMPIRVVSQEAFHVIEGKAAEAIAPSHRGQALHYLLLAETRQAFTRLLGGLTLELRPVALLSGEREVHRHFMHLLTEDEGLVVTAMSEIHESRRHLQRLLDHTRLAGIAWVNLPVSELRFELLKNHGPSESNPSRRASISPASSG